MYIHVHVQVSLISLIFYWLIYLNFLCALPLSFFPSPSLLFLQTLPVAPLYGDVQIRFADWIRQLPHYDPSKWTCTSEQQEEKVTVAIQNRVEIIRSEHVRFISELARYNNEVRRREGGREGGGREGGREWKEKN